MSWGGVYGMFSVCWMNTVWISFSTGVTFENSMKEVIITLNVKVHSV